MTRSARELALDAAIVVVTLCAITMTAIRVRAEIARRNGEKEAFKTVTAWRQYARNDYRDGPREAAVTVVDFSDFQCPFCRRASNYLDGVRKRYPANVAVIYRHFPIHQFGSQSAIAAECAGQQARFQEMRQALFARPESIGVKTWTAYATRAGVPDTSAFLRCLATPAVRELVLRDSMAGSELSMTGTPTFLINDLRVLGFQGDSIMDGLISEALRRAKH